MKRVFIYCDDQTRSCDPIELHDAISKMGKILTNEGCFWIINTRKSVKRVRDELLQFNPDFDRLLVGDTGLELSHDRWGSKDLTALDKFFTLDG
jgi:hypothetical protein